MSHMSHITHTCIHASHITHTCILYVFHASHITHTYYTYILHIHITHAYYTYILHMHITHTHYKNILHIHITHTYYTYILLSLPYTHRDDLRRHHFCQKGVLQVKWKRLTFALKRIREKKIVTRYSRSSSQSQVA